jgi:hypothetical protein
MSEPFGYFKAEPFGWTDCAETDDGAVPLYEHPPVQQEVDLSGLKPATQEVVKGWIEDGTFIKRAIGAMQEQEAENMRLEKMVEDQPAQEFVCSTGLCHYKAQRPWVGLTHDEYDAICDKHSAMSDFDFLADIEAKLREKNQ